MSQDNAVHRMTLLAQQLRSSLTTEQRRAVSGELGDPRLREWSYLPGDRPGLALQDLSPDQHAVALELLTASESPEGAGRTVGAIEVERVQAFAFGDLEHSGAMAYRAAQFGPLDLEVVEPLHGMTTQECSTDFLASGIEAVTVVVDASVLDEGHLGVPLTQHFVASLPPGCDPCGETGEFHTFVSDAPFFRTPVDFTTGQSERVERTIGTSDGLQRFAYWRLHLH